VDTEYNIFEILHNRSVKGHMSVREKQRALDMFKAVGAEPSMNVLQLTWKHDKSLVA
jgi:hypothetical protein